MRLFNVLKWNTLLFLGYERVCPNNNVSTMAESYHNATVTNEIKSWYACSDLCRQSNDCRYWTWYKDDPRANECVTMTTHDDFKSDNNAVSGDRNCEGKMINPNFQFLL